ncbi:hypothetical protein GWI33_004745 [Rhynchophorus ferrugineus]|uniref:Uncharacterized protein n=3 Tax=Rhynchophorus ferrugineus TaxID=354439 RepID=A0A834III6_RHYFE|nr:hypothetical protein GWI33_004745 [Rhynchophorus ferrugineus]
MDPLLEIRKLPPSVTTHLSYLLDYGSQWKHLMAIIPKKLSIHGFVSAISEINPVKYSVEDIQTIDQGARQYNKSPTLILLDEWGTSGRPRANLGHLLHLLTKANLYRAADYVSVELLKQPPISRPESGPASTVKLLSDDLVSQDGTEIDTEHVPLPNKVKHLLKQVQNVDVNQNEIAVSCDLLTKPENKSLESLLEQIDYPFSDSDVSFSVNDAVRSDITTSRIESIADTCEYSNIREDAVENLESASTKGIKPRNDAVPHLSMLLAMPAMNYCKRMAVFIIIRLTLTANMFTIFDVIRFWSISFYIGVMCCQELSPIVTINDGKVQGILNRTVRDGRVYYAYRGIPFAKKPVGDLRFAPPVPNEPWSGVLNTTTDRDSCTQVLTAEDPTLLTGSEDCLYINVYTTNLTGRLPVMVWIYGGSFVFGSSEYKIYPPDYLIEKDVIFVSFNYRLGVFGFLSTEDLAAPGNWGIKDQILALKWVKNNIAHFGGDPNKVTIFGESAGAASVSYIVNNPSTKDLYGGAIMQSGTSLCVFALTRNARQKTELVAKELNITETNSTNLIKRLRLVDYKKLKAAEVNVTIKVFVSELLGGETFGVVEEPYHPGAVHTGRTYEILKKGRFNRVPSIIGFNSNELGATLTSDNYDVVTGILNLTATPAVFAPYDLTGNVSKLNEAGKLVISHYLGPSPTISDAERIYKYLTENHFNRPIRQTVNMMSRYSKVYYYMFSYEGNLGNPNRTVPGVHHAEELSYIYNKSRAVSEKDALTIQRVVTLWTNFAKTRNPTSSNRTGVLRNIKWKPNTPNTNVNQEVCFLNINKTLIMQKNPNQDEWLFYKNIYDTYGDPSYYTTY